MALLEIRNLTKIYPQGESLLGGRSRGSGEVPAVDNVSLDIHSGETLGLVGESGSGKSTLGRLILRLIEPTSGSIRFEDRDLLAASPSEMRRLRRDMQIIFQDPFASLDPRFRVEDIIAEPLIIHGIDGGKREGHDFSRADSVSVTKPASAAEGQRSTKSARRARVVELLRAVGLDDSILQRFPHEFSGGQRQRIGIARALALQRDFGLTYLFISHSMPVVRYLSTRIAVMYRGKIVEVGQAEQITDHPQHPYTRSLLEATPEVTV